MRLLTFEASLTLALLSFGAREARGQAVEIEFERVKWARLSPEDTAVRVAVLRVDPASSATHMLYQLPPNATSPCHWHTASQGTMVLRGSMTVRRTGASAGPRLGVGGYSFVAGGTPFQIITGPTGAVVIASLDGAFDIHAGSSDKCMPAGSSSPVRDSTARAYEVEYEKIPWVTFSPKDTTVRIATLRVDPASGATHMVFNLPPNDASPCHWHSPAENNVVVRGTAGMRHNGASTRPTLGVGGYSFVPKRVPHQITTGPSGTLVFSTLDGRFDFHLVDLSQCR